jgi:hypothetical protein
MLSSLSTLAGLQIIEKSKPGQLLNESGIVLSVCIDADVAKMSYLASGSME